MQQSQPHGPQNWQDDNKKRPTGVTILTILFVIGGLMALVAPLMMTAVLAPIAEFVAGIMIICWIVFGVIGLLYFVTAYGLWTGQGWARLIAIILAILSLFNIPIGTIIGIVILIYLFRDDVKAYFGEGRAQQQTKTCLSCGQQIGVQYSVCPYCGRSTSAPQQQQQYGAPPQQQQPPQQQGRQCPDCGGGMRYVNEYNRWYCDRCQGYK